MSACLKARFYGACSETFGSGRKTHGDGMRMTWFDRVGLARHNGEISAELGRRPTDVLATIVSDGEGRILIGAQIDDPKAKV